VIDSTLEFISNAVWLEKTAVFLAVYMQFRPCQGAEKGQNSPTGFPSRLNGYGILGPNVGLMFSPSPFRKWRVVLGDTPFRKRPWDSPRGAPILVLVTPPRFGDQKQIFGDKKQNLWREESSILL